MAKKAGRKKAATKTAKTAGTKAPWERRNPKSAAKHKTLSPAAKAAARQRAKRAGRPYPNLVDNMRAAAGKKRRASASASRTRRRDR